MPIHSDMNVCGIYSITHLGSERTYVGSSKDIKSRIRKHREALRTGKHHSKYMQRVFDKYGQDSFEVKTLVICEEQNLKMYEQRFIDGLCPAFNGSKSANAPVHRGQKLPEEWRNKVAQSVRERYANGFTVTHPPRSEAYRTLMSEKSKQRWQDEEYRTKNASAIKAAMTEKECAARSERTKKLWQDPDYREKSIATRKGKSYNKGYKCTPEQIENRRKAARISNAKRSHGDKWKEIYLERYPEYAGDLDA